MIAPRPLLAAARLLALLLLYPLAVAAAESGKRDRVDSTPYKPYLSVGTAAISPENARFINGADGGHYPLYGGEDKFDDGMLSEGSQALFAAGIRLRTSIRLQLEYGLTREREYSGNTNYSTAGPYQPSEAMLDTRQVLLAAFRDFSEWEYAAGRSIRPFLGIGVGVTKYRLSDYVQNFPDTPNPDGRLRRGAAGEIPYTALPPGSDGNFTSMMTAGIAIPVSKNMELDLSYRYTDAGEIHTNIGEMKVVRFRENGKPREIFIKINETRTDLRTHSLSLSLRFEW